jgi:hypothetical protein
MYGRVGVVLRQMPSGLRAERGMGRKAKVTLIGWPMMGGLLAGAMVLGLALTVRNALARHFGD